MSAWTDFRRAVFGDPYLVWHDGADFTALLRLARAEPERVAAMLRAGIGEQDPVAAQSVRTLAEENLAPQGFQDVMTEALPAATGSFRIDLACALAALTGDQAWAGKILPRGVHPDHRGWSRRRGRPVRGGRAAQRPRGAKYRRADGTVSRTA